MERAHGRPEASPGRRHGLPQGRSPGTDAAGGQSPRPWPAGGLVALQAQAGNAAVSEAIQRRAALVLQRADDENPADFCKPFPDRQTALDTRSGFLARGFLALASATFNPAVADLWRQYLDGGRSGVQALTDTGIVRSFATDPVTDDAAERLAERVKGNVEEGVRVGDGEHPVSEIVSRADRFLIGSKMDFDTPLSIPGNIAGGISEGQETSNFGAIPSHIADQREIGGTVNVATGSDGKQTLAVRPHFKVTDTIDFCPGGSGSFAERQVTVPFSRCEASGVSGDVPFTVEFDGNMKVRSATPGKPRDAAQ